MQKIVKESLIEEGYGAGFSTSSSSRSGFGGANNLGGPNMMYTYEIKPLTHTLEQKPTSTVNKSYDIQIGSRILGYPIRSNAYPDNKQISGIIRKIILADNGSFKYYVVQDEATQQLVNVDPTSAQLIVHEPEDYYINRNDNYTSRRKQKLKSFSKGNVVAESLFEINKTKEA